METLCLAHHPLRLVATFLQLRGASARVKPEELVYTPLKGGRSSSPLYRFSLDRHSYVLKCFAPQTTLLTRKHQITLAQQAGKIGVGPQVLCVDPQGEGFIMEYIAGKTVTPAHFEDPNHLALFARFLRRLHHSLEPFPSAPSPFRRFDAFLARKNLPPELVAMKAPMERLESLLTRNPLPLAPTHLDLNSLNIMFVHESYFLVDWANGGTSDPYFDLSAFALLHNLDDVQSKVFLTHYFGRDPHWGEWSRFVVTQPMRLFTIAAALLSVSSEELSFAQRVEPLKLADFLRENAEGNTEWPHRQIGFTMLHAGINLLEGHSFKTAFKELKEKETFR